MNKFTKNKSKIFFAVCWLFIAAMFSDGANLDDLIPGTIVVHSDEDNDTQTDYDLLVNVHDNSPVRSQSLPQHPKKQETPQPTTTLRVIYDQDSDSLAAAPVSLAESFVPLLPETLVEYESTTSAHSLYLLNCTLLI